MLTVDWDSLPSVSSRRELTTMVEVRSIQNDQNHSCHGVLAGPIDYPYGLRPKNGGR